MNDITNSQSDRINPDFVQQYIMANSKFFPEDSINELKARLSKLSQNQFNAIQGIQLKDPMIMLLLALYGMEPLSYDVGLLEVITVKSQIINIRNVKKNDKISYGSKGIVNRDSKIGIVSIGYAHGFQKQIENSEEAYVLINGKKAKIIGEICMDMIFIDLTDIENVEVNDEIVIVGSQKNIENGIVEKIILR